jgi:ATP synthase protein I
MTGAFAVYLGQVLVLFILIAVLRDATWLDGRVLAATVLACTIVWILASVVAWQRTDVLVVTVPTSEIDDAAPASSNDVVQPVTSPLAERGISEIQDTAS